MKPLKINNSSEIKQILDKAKDISIAEEMGIMTYIYDLEQKVKGIDKAIEYIHNHQLVFELSSKKQIQKWFDEFYAKLFKILGGE